MKKVIFVAMIMIVVAVCVCLCPIGQVEAQAVAPSCSAKSMIVMEQSTGRVLKQKNADAQLAIASTTKIVTCLTVIDNCPNLDKVVTIGKNSVGVSGTSIYLREGEKLTVRDLLYGLMLQSGNDAATALAYEVGGDISKFASMMENTARRCGAHGCNFENPHGLDSAGHHASARDLANITRHALNNSTFCEIVGSKYHKIAESDSTTGRYLKNKNKLLFRFDGATGVKTGYTGNAGRCLVSSCTRNGLSLVCVVLNCGPMFEESEALFEWAFSNYRMREIIPPYFVCGTTYIENGVKDEVDLFVTQGFKYPLTDEEYMKVQTIYDCPERICAPVLKEKIVGRAKIMLDNDLLFETNIYTMEGVESKFINKGLKDLVNKWFNR